MKLPEGFSVSLFAAEPDVVQPIAMTIDPKGRLWVVENYSYPVWLGGQAATTASSSSKIQTATAAPIAARCSLTRARTSPASSSASAECGSARRPTCCFSPTATAT